VEENHWLIRKKLEENFMENCSSDDIKWYQIFETAFFSSESFPPTVMASTTRSRSTKQSKSSKEKAKATTEDPLTISDCSSSIPHHPPDTADEGSVTERSLNHSPASEPPPLPLTSAFEVHPTATDEGSVIERSSNHSPVSKPPFPLPSAFEVLRVLGHKGELTLLLRLQHPLHSRFRATVEKSCLASLADVKEGDVLEVLQASVVHGDDTFGGRVTLSSARIIPHSRPGGTSSNGKEEREGQEVGGEFVLASALLKRKRPEFSFESSKRTSSTTSLEARVISFDKIDFSRYEGVVSPQKPPPFNSVLKVLFLGATVPLPSPNRPDVYRKDMQFLDYEDLSNEVGGNKVIRGVVFELSVVKGMQQGKVYYLQKVVPNVYQDLKQIKLTRFSQVTPATEEAGGHGGKMTSLLKLFNLDEISGEGGPLPLKMLPQRVNVVGIILQSKVTGRRIKIGCPSGICVAVVVAQEELFPYPVGDSHSSRAAILFNVKVYMSRGLRTLWYDEYSSASYDDPRTEPASHWFNSQRKMLIRGKQNTPHHKYHNQPLHTFTKEQLSQLFCRWCAIVSVSRIQTN
jgi:hypothetical protein